MGKKVFKVTLSKSSLENLKRQLTDYKEKLPSKCEKIVKRLLESGVEVASAKVSESPLGKYVIISTDISYEKMGCKGILLAKGEVKESGEFDPFSTLLAIEFGAGIHYNSEPNPKAGELGFGVGTFPNQIHAFQEEGWMYWDENAQEWKHTYGVQATMPMYSADMDIIDNIVKIARDVFD